MSRETAIQEVAEICAALENDSPEDNLELARLIVETVERNLTQRAADGLHVLQCAECGEQTSMNHKESCSKRRR